MTFRIFLSIILLISSQEILSQEYVKLLNQDRTWKILYWVCGYDPCDSQNRYYSIQKDTIINDTLYQELDGYFLREDTIQQIVFKRNGEHDEILYDFKLLKGDTVDWLGQSWNSLIVDSIYQISIENKSRKCIAFKEHEGFNEIWIEGIGSNYGILFPGFYLSLIDAGYELLCVFDGNNPIYGGCNPLNIPSNTNLDSYLEVSFISSLEALSIKGMKCSEFVLQIFGINGSVLDIYQLSSEGDELLVNLRDYKEGIYIYRIISQEQTDQGRFLITK